MDIGNTEIGIGLYGGGAWRGRFRVRTVMGKTPDEYRTLLWSLLSGTGVNPGQLQRAAVGSVVPPLTHTFRELLSGWLPIPPLMVGPGVRTGLNLQVDHPSQVGADLVANAVAAYHRFGEPCIAVDFGTATTFTGVQDPGALVGVAIAPGLGVAAESLARGAALLPEAALEPPPHALGKNTQAAMQSGLIFGYVGLVDELIGRLRAELGGTARTVATGGHAPLIAPLAESIEVVDPWLTLEGLRLIAERNP
ncbi:MAG: type III pantothenate kinase [Candidatus Bipolaricaulaceae bacterium]